MKSFSKAVILAFVLVLPVLAPVYAQGGDDPAPPHATAQHVRFEHLTTEQGLSSNIVWGVVQDDYGFIWIGTLDGLNRYDGSISKIYRYDPRDPNSLGDNSVRTLARDRAGNIWIGSWGGGLNKFDPSTEQFTRYKHDPDDPQSLGGNQVFTIYEDQAGVLWVGTAAGLDRLDRETNTFTHYRHDPDDPRSLSHDGVHAVYAEQSGDLWIGTNGGGLSRLDPDTGEFIQYRHDPADPNSLGSDRVASIYQDPAGIVWIGTHDKGVSRFDPESGLFANYVHDPNDPNSLGGNDIRGIHQDREGVLWFGGGYGGVFQFDRDTAKFVRHQHDENDPSSLSHNGVVDIYGDSEGTLWIATAGGGVNRLDPNRKPFALYRHSPADPGSLSNNDVRSMYVDHTETLWVGTVLGLSRFNGRVEPGSDSAQFTRYMHDRADPQGLNGVYVMSMVEDREGALWIGTLEKGLIRFDRDSDSHIDPRRFAQYQHDPNDPHSLNPNLVRDLYVDSSGTLWVGTLGGGLAWFDSETEEFHRFQRDPNNPNSLSDNSVMSILEDDSGELWIATLNGLNRFVRETEEFVRYPHDPNDPDSLSHSNALDLFQDREGVLWVGTNGGGLDRFESQDERFVHYTKKDGLPSDMIAGITQDEQGFLWLSTSQGLSKFDPRSETFRNYDASEGLQGNQFNINSVARSRSGELFFGGVDGFNGFYPNDMKDSPTIPPIVITDFQLANRPVEIGGDSVLQESIVETRELVLSHEDRVISFEFAALNYSSPEKNRYRYKLEGFDEGWTEAGSDRRFVTYTNLDPGKYVFRVTGSNNDGVWNDEGTSINITITPPWWQTWGFRGGLLLLLVGLVVGGFVSQRASARRRQRQLEALVAERTHELGERVKELDCLYDISSLAGQRGISLEEILRGTAALLPAALQYPEIACARLVLDGQEFKTDDFRKTHWQQSAAITVQGEEAGQVEVGYLEERPEADDGAFLEEERLLLNAVAERLGRIAERKQAEAALQEAFGAADRARRLETARRQEAERGQQIAEVLGEVVAALNSEEDLEEVLDLIARRARDLLGADAVAVCELEPDTLAMTILAAHGLPTGHLAGAIVPLTADALRQAVASQRPVAVRDLSISLLQEGQTPFVSGAADYQVLLAVPIVGEGQAYGGLALYYTRPRLLSSEEIELADLLGDHGALAVENARLRDEIKEAAVDAERTRLAGELHDAVTQGLYSASLIAETLPLVWEEDPEAGRRGLEDLRHLTEGALAEMRTLLLELRPAVLAEQELAVLLQQLADTMTARTRTAVTTTVVGDCSLPTEAKITLYRIAQEALNNVAKHARARLAKMGLQCDGVQVTLSIRDDGRGFDPSVTGSHQLGINIMRDRARAIGARLTIKSELGRGTEVSVVWLADG